MSAPITIAYWKIRGLAHAMRYALEYSELPYENVMYEVGPGPEYSRESWFSVKHTLGLDFPNLPYLIDGEVKITQSNACLRYIARKAGLYGSSDEEKAAIDMLLDQVMDLRNGYVRLCYGPGYEENLKTYTDALEEKFKLFARYLGEKKFLLGDNISIADFHFVEMVDQHTIHFPELAEMFPTLKKRANIQKAYRERFFALPKIKEYVESDRFFARPINNPMANFK